MKLTYTETTLGIPPKSPSAGQFWYDEQNKVAGVWDEYERRWVKFSVIEHDHDGAYARGGFTHLSKRGIIVNKEDKYLDKILSNIRDASSTNPYTVFLGPGEYLISGLVTVPDYVNIVGVDRDNSVFYSSTAAVTTMFELGEDSTLSNFTINHYGAFAGTAELIRPTAASSHVTLENLNINVDFASNSDVVLDLVTYSGSYIDIVGCNFINAEDANAGTAISMGNSFSDVLISNNIFRYFGQGVVDASSAVSDKVIIKNYFYNCETAILASDSCFYIRTDGNICESCTHGYVCTSVGATWSTRFDACTWELDESTIVDSIIYVDTLAPIKDVITISGILHVTDDTTIDGTLILPSGAGANKVLVSDADGNSSWATLTAASPLHWTALALDIGGLSSYGKVGQIIKVAAGGTSLEWGDEAAGTSLTFSEPLVKDIGDNVTLGGLASYGSNGQILQSTGSAVNWVTISGIEPGGIITSRINDDDNDTYVEVESTTDDDVIRLYAGGQGNMFITTYGVGIKMNPAYPLDVNGILNLHSSQLSINGSTGSAGQVLTVDVGDATVKWATPAATTSAQIIDADTDTYVNVEVTSDADTIQFNAGGQDVATMSSALVTIKKDLDLVTKVIKLNGALGTDGQVLAVNSAETELEWVTISGGGTTTLDKIIDADGDTKVLTEVTPDDDCVRIYAAGVEVAAAASTKFQVVKTLDVASNVIQLNNTFGIPGQVMAVDDAGTALEWVTVSGGSSPSSGNITISGQNGIVVTSEVVGDTTNYIVSASGVFFSLNFDCTLEYSTDVYISATDALEELVLESGMETCFLSIVDVVSGIDSIITSSYSWS